MPPRMIAMPSEDRLPPGPKRDLVAAVYDLYREANFPSTRVIAKGVSRDDTLVASISHDTVHKFLGGWTLPRWHTIHALVMWLAYAAEHPNPDRAVMRIQALWREAQLHDDQQGNIATPSADLAVNPALGVPATRPDLGIRAAAALHASVVPKLASTIVDRVSLRDAVLAGLLQAPARRVTILGGAGFGKTTLAAGVYHDPMARQHFDDVCWFHVGRKPALVTLMDDIHRAILGIPLDRLDLAAAVSALHRINAGERCLVVLDDVLGRGKSDLSNRRTACCDPARYDSFQTTCGRLGVC